MCKAAGPFYSWINFVILDLHVYSIMLNSTTDFSFIMIAIVSKFVYTLYISLKRLMNMILNEMYENPQIMN